MNPKYIFSAVIAISILLISLLPQLGRSANVPAAQAEQQSAPLPIVTVLPTTPPNIRNDTVQNRDKAPKDNALPEDSSEARSEQASSSEPQAKGFVEENPELSNFVTSVRNNQPGTVTGIFAPGLFGMPVTGQPNADETYVSSEENVLTQYKKPSEFGVVAILAHNYLNSGKLLSQVSPNQEIFVVYGDGKVRRFRVSSVQYYQALSPHDNRSDFRDLNGPGGEILRFDQLFNRVYTQSNQLVFQTCLEANGDLSWGRIFISADPAD